MSDALAKAPSGLPGDAVLLGHISGAFGIKGWIKVQPYSQQAEALLSVAEWWLRSPQNSNLEVAHLQAIAESKWHSGVVVARLVGIDNRNGAEALRGAEVWLSRQTFPATRDDEYYWVDLLGMQVINLQAQVLGKVVEVFDNGAHQVLVVEAEADHPTGKLRQRLLPFVSAYVLAVDEPSRTIRVDWLPEWDEG